jgi:hypothetical protein
MDFNKGYNYNVLLEEELRRRKLEELKKNRFGFIGEVIEVFNLAIFKRRYKLIFPLLLYVISLIYGFWPFFKSNTTGELFSNYTPGNFISLFGGFAFLFLALIASKKIEVNKKIENIVTRQDDTIDKDINVAAWELAKLRFDTYLNRNIRQIKSIYFITVGVMIAGFALIVAGIITILNNPSSPIKGPLVSVVSGIIINFIGATFMMIYQSVVKQAKSNIEILERMNLVGMSLSIVNSISDESIETKNLAKEKIIDKLFDVYSNIK